MGHANLISRRNIAVNTDRYMPSYDTCGLTMMYHRASRAIYWT